MKCIYAVFICIYLFIYMQLLVGWEIEIGISEYFEQKTTLPLIVLTFVLLHRDY